MNTQQAVEFIGNQFDCEYEEHDLEVVHIATVQAIGSKVEEMLKSGVSLQDALAAYMLTNAKEAGILRTAVQNAVKEEIEG